MWTTRDQSPVPELTPHEADDLARDAEALLVDYGEPEDWLAGHLPRARLIAPDTLDRDARLLPKDRPVVVAARHNDVAHDTCALLRRMGLDARVLKGGVQAWRRAGLPVVQTDAARHH